jgi:trigger factor
MKASWEKTAASVGVLTVEVDEQAVAGSLDQAFKKVVKGVNVPGFRRGKIPRLLFEQRFGVTALYKEALDILLPAAYDAAIKETGIEPIASPEVEIERFEKGNPLLFKVTVTVKPEVHLGNYKELEVEEKDFSVKDEDIVAELARMQMRQGHLETVEEGTVEVGHRVIIDFEGFVDGIPFEGGKEDKYTLDVGSNLFIPGFEEQLVGMSAGEEKEIAVTFPEPYPVEKLAGKPAIFKVKLHEIKRLHLPQLDDDFAQDVSEFDTLSELKTDIEQKLQKRADREKENYIRNTLTELAANNAEVEIPAVLVDREVEHHLQKLASQDIHVDAFAQMIGQDEAILKEMIREEAAKRVRAALVLEAIAKAEQVEVSEAEIEQEIEQMAQEMGREVTEVHRLFETQGTLPALKEKLFMKKTVDLLVSARLNKA